MEATHSQMCKFDSPNAPGFRAVSTDIRQWIIDAPALISVRWEVEENEIAARMCNELQERFSISDRIPSLMSQQAFITSTTPPRRGSDISVTSVPRSLITAATGRVSPTMFVFQDVDEGAQIFKLRQGS